MRAFERRLERHAQEAGVLAEIATQLSLTAIAGDLFEAQAALEGIRQAAVGSPR